MNLLSSGVRAISGAAPAAQTATGASDFSSMLGKARAGELSTGLPVTIARGADIELSENQLSRLAQAADRAESAGARRALVLIDGRALEVDVTTRQVVREHPMADSRVITGIDAVIGLDPARGTRAAGQEAGAASGDLSAPEPLGVPGTGAGLGPSRWSRSLLETLAAR